MQWNDVYVRLLAPKTGSSCASICVRRAAGIASMIPIVPRTPASTMAVLARAKRAGVAISAVSQHIHQQEGAGGIRRILGVLALAKKHGPAVAEQAAKTALDLGVPTYRFRLG